MSPDPDSNTPTRGVCALRSADPCEHGTCRPLPPKCALGYPRTPPPHSMNAAIPHGTSSSPQAETSLRDCRAYNSRHRYMIAGTNTSLLMPNYERAVGAVTMIRACTDKDVIETTRRALNPIALAQLVHSAGRCKQHQTSKIKAAPTLTTADSTGLR